jgi:hypothetical protein
MESKYQATITTRLTRIQPIPGETLSLLYELFTTRPHRKILTEASKRRETNNGLSFASNSLSLSHTQISMEHSSSNSYLETDIKIENPGLPETVIGTQGLRKQTLRRGNSWQTPFPGDEVEGNESRTPHKSFSLMGGPTILLLSTYLFHFYYFFHKTVGTHQF